MDGHRAGRTRAYESYSHYYSTVSCSLCIMPFALRRALLPSSHSSVMGQCMEAFIRAAGRTTMAMVVPNARSRPAGVLATSKSNCAHAASPPSAHACSGSQALHQETSMQLSAGHVERGPRPQERPWLTVHARTLCL